MMILRGRAYKIERDNINTDEIIPARYLNVSEPEILGKHCMEGLDSDFPKKVKKGDILVVGKNFGCGSSREHAVVAIKSCGIGAVIGESFARIFFRNAINTGLPLVVSEGWSKEISTGDILEINFERGIVKNLSKKKKYNITPFPKFIQEIIKSNGLMRYLKNVKRAKDIAAR
jgi:3-isopropylmalate/(R)-2-methylmalate dehydratase small subunit